MLDEGITVLPMPLFPKFQGAATPLFSAKGWSYGVAQITRLAFLLGLCKTINPKTLKPETQKPYTNPENVKPLTLKPSILKPKAIIPMYSQCFRSSSGDRYMILFAHVTCMWANVGVGANMFKTYAQGPFQHFFTQATLFQNHLP